MNISQRKDVNVAAPGVNERLRWSDNLTRRETWYHGRLPCFLSADLHSTDTTV